jgi:hypothetical protein
MFRRLVIAGVLVTAAFASIQTKAQDVPDAGVQEGLVKEALITFNDANMTGNYEVMRLRTAKPFQDKFSAENGVLTLDGHFATRPLEVNYTLDFIVEDNDWALIGIDVSAHPVE